MDEVIINNYKLETPFENTNAGFSRWAYCQNLRDGEQYFIKEFLNPVFPLEDSPYEENVKMGMRVYCQDYERKMTALYKAINDASDGNIVRIQSFFRFKSKYYIITKRVDVEADSFEKSITSLSQNERKILCLVLCHAAMRLHQKHIVHADLKPANLLLERTQKGFLTLKVIDFDGSFFERDGVEELVGDQVYFAPEAVRFIQEGPDSVKLTCKLDVFALGLIMHQILTDELPQMPMGDTYAFEAVLNDHPLILSGDLPDGYSDVIQGMLQADPELRYSISEVFERLNGLRTGREIMPQQAEVSDAEPETVDSSTSSIAGEETQMTRIRIGKGLKVRDEGRSSSPIEDEPIATMFRRPKGFGD